MDKIKTSEREKRSILMGKIQGRNTIPEQIMLSRILRRQRIRYVFQPDLPGHPDFLVKNFNCVIFVHGCFWHGCRKHFRMPKTNVDFWKNKIEGNIRRNTRNIKELKRMGFSVIEILEHDLR